MEHHISFSQPKARATESVLVGFHTLRTDLQELKNIWFYVFHSAGKKVYSTLHILETHLTKYYKSRQGLFVMFICLYFYGRKRGSTQYKELLPWFHVSSQALDTLSTTSRLLCSTSETSLRQAEFPDLYRFNYSW